MAATKAAAAKKSTTNTRRVQQDKVPAELRGFYDDEPQDEEVSLSFTTEPGEDEAPVEMEKLFDVNGVDYMIPVKFGPGVGLIYLDRISEGRDVALGEILKRVIGEEGWKALLKLAELDRISPAQLKAIMNKVQGRTLGAVEDIEGN